MGLDKNSKKADRLANLYRAALYLGKGKVSAGMSFLKKAGENQKKPKTKKECLLLAEEVLDKYHRLRFQP